MWFLVVTASEALGSLPRNTEFSMSTSSPSLNSDLKRFPSTLSRNVLVQSGFVHA